MSKWKIHDGGRERNIIGGGGGGDPLEDHVRKKEAPPHAAVSARKLAAGIWRMQLPEAAAGDGGRRRVSRKIGEDRLGVQVKPLLGFFFVQ